MNKGEMKRKIKKVVDDPADAIEAGVKKSWKITKAFGTGLEKEVIGEKKKKAEK